MFVKHASSRFSIVAEHGTIAGHLGVSQETMSRLAESGVLELDPDRFLYLRARLVSALEHHGPNDNGDGFPEDELRRRAGTFKNSGVYLDHDNSDESKAYGWIADAYYVPFDPATKQGGWVEGVLVVDKDLVERDRPGLIAKITSPNHPTPLTDGSMGCLVQWSECSRCGHVATTPEEYCECIKTSKGGGGVYEINRGVTFFEWSLLDPAGKEGGIGADPDAKILERYGSRATQSPLAALVVRRKPQGCGVCVKRCDQGRFPDKQKATIKEAGMAEQGKPKVAALPGGPTAPAETDQKGNPNAAMKDKGDYASAGAINQEMKEQTGGIGTAKSPDTTSRGNPNNTMVDRADYGLTAARVAGAAVQAAVREVLAEGEDTFPGGTVGGKPKEVEDAEKKLESARDDSASPSPSPSPKGASVRKQAEATGIPEAAETAGEATEKATSGVTSPEVTDQAERTDGYKVGSLREQAVVEAAKSGFVGWLRGMFNKKADAGRQGGGNPQVMSDRGNYTEAADKDGEFKAQSDAWNQNFQTNRTQQVNTGFLTPQQRIDQQTGQKALQAQGAKEEEALDYIVRAMASGKTYERAEAEARQMYAARLRKRAFRPEDVQVGDTFVESGEAWGLPGPITVTNITDEGITLGGGHLAPKRISRDEFEDRIDRGMLKPASLHKQAEGTAADLSPGNLPTKYGPETSPIADAANAQQETELKAETQGASVPTKIQEYSQQIHAIKTAQSVAEVFKGMTSGKDDSASPSPSPSPSKRDAMSYGAVDSPSPSPDSMSREGLVTENNALDSDSSSGSDSPSPSDSKSAAPPLPTPAPTTGPAPATSDMGAGPRMGASNSDSASKPSADTEAGDPGTGNEPEFKLSAKDAYAASDSLSKSMESKADSVTKEIEKKKEEAALNAQHKDVERARTAVKVVRYLTVEREKYARAASVLKSKRSALARVYSDQGTPALRRAVLASLTADITAARYVLAQPKKNLVIPTDLQKAVSEKGSGASKDQSLMSQKLEQKAARLENENAELRAALRQATANFRGELKSIAMEKVAAFEETLGINPEFSHDQRMQVLAQYTKEQLEAMAEAYEKAAEKIPGKGPIRNAFSLGGGMPPRSAGIKTQEVKDELDGIFDDPRMAQKQGRW